MKALHLSVLASFMVLNAGISKAALEGVSNTFYGQGAGVSAGDDDNSVFVGKNAGFANTSGNFNTFLGFHSGFNTSTGSSNTFLGSEAGYSNTTGYHNLFLGRGAGYTNSTGFENIYVGRSAGYNNSQGIHNTFFGTLAGANNLSGSSNVFLGYSAGFNEAGSNRLYIDTSSTSTPLIYGEFDNRKVTLYGNLDVVGPDAGLVRLTDVNTDLTTKGARLVLKHYNNAQLPVYLFGAASTPANNFLAFGGGNNVGNAVTQLDFFTAPTPTTPYGTSRLTALGNGNIGIGTQSPVYPLQMASGAHVTSGGVWTNASSREYKENIQSLSAADATLTLAKLNPVTYKYKSDNTQGHVGFIAEDVPELVATKDRKGLSPMDIVAVLTKVVKEQQEALQVQQGVNSAHEQTIAELKEQNKALAEAIPALSATLTDLKREVRIGRTTALAD